MILNSSLFCLFRKKSLAFLSIVFCMLLLTSCAQLSNNSTSAQSKAETQLTNAELAFSQKQKPDLSAIDFNSLNVAQKARYLRLKIAITPKTDVNSQIRNYIELEKYSTPQERKKVLNQTWDYLKSLSAAQQKSVEVYPQEQTLKGWMDFLSITQANAQHKQKSLFDLLSLKTDQTQQQEIKTWQARYPTHPAMYFFTATANSELAALPAALKIALFIPQSGTAKIYGDAILAGMKNANLYDSQLPKAAIQVYDTNGANLQNLADRAQQDGAQIIVGPLIKKNVEAMAQVKTALPILALNKIDAPQLTQNEICYFALAPEDEAMNAAQRIAKQDKKQPLLILPNNKTGQRIGESFINEWALQTGNAELPIYFFDSYEALSERINSKNKSALKGSMMKVQNHQLTATYSASERADSIYVYANNDEYILIHSLLGLDAKAQKLPVYLSSQTHQANLNRDTRLDLEQAQIVDIPLLIQPKQYKVTLPTYIKDDYFLIRLYAMGVDAVNLATHFETLKNSAQTTFNGLTGTLSRTSDCRVQQALTWGVYRSGRLSVSDAPPESTELPPVDDVAPQSDEL